jgi:ribosomal protein S4E
MRGGFRPFVLHLSDGRKFEIAHPEFIAVGKSIVIVLREDDLAETLDAEHIVSVEDLSPKRPR